MEYEKQETKEGGQEVLDQILDIEPISFIVPECCREGWPDCPHIPQRQRRVKLNIGL